MRGLFFVPAALAGAFFLGRDTSPEVATASAGARVIAVRQGDVVRVPAGATECVVSGEADVTDFFCERKPRGRYHVVLYADWIRVWRVGNPDTPAFARRWKP